MARVTKGHLKRGASSPLRMIPAEVGSMSFSYIHGTGTIIIRTDEGARSMWLILSDDEVEGLARFFRDSINRYRDIIDHEEES